MKPNSKSHLGIKTRSSRGGMPASASPALWQYGNLPPRDSLFASKSSSANRRHPAALLTVFRRCLTAISLMLAVFAMSTSARGVTLEDFGYNNMKVNGKLSANTTRPLLVILVNSQGSESFAHPPAYYENVIYGYGSTTPNVNGYFRAQSNWRFFYTPAGTIQVSLSADKAGDSAQALLAAMRVNPTLFKYYADANNNVTADRLAILIISNIINEGQTRPEGVVTSELSWIFGGGVNWGPGKVPRVQHRASLQLMCHEMTHALGAIDIYGVWGQESLNTNLSLMANDDKAPDGRAAWYLDPWHRMQLGWCMPRICSFPAGGELAIAASQTLDPSSPVILYDPARLTGEFFMVEYRSQIGGGYDANVAGNGVAVWRVKQDAFHNPVLVPRVDGGPIIGQSEWRYCDKCKGLHFISDWRNPVLGICPGGGVHQVDGSGGYMMVHNHPEAEGQHGWNWCKKCQSLFFGPSSAASRCIRGGTHDGSSSGDYSLVQNVPASPGQHGWKWCRKCQSLFYGPSQAASKCPAGTAHDSTGSGDYAMVYSGDNYVVWNEGAPNLARGGNGLWGNNATTPVLRWLGGVEFRGIIPIFLGPDPAGKVTVLPFTTGAASVRVRWQR